MKFSCSTSDLLESLHLVSRAIGNQQALPILGNILFKAEGKQCTVSATDLELSIVTSFPATIESEGSVTVPAKAILNFAQYNNDAEVLLETSEGTQLKCTSSHAKSVVAGESANEYPTITPVEKQMSLSLEPGPLLNALHLVTFACAKTSLRPVLSGVYLRSEQGKIILAATDSYRLSEYVIPAAGTDAELSCIIPVKILEELKVILGSRKGDKKENTKNQAPKSKDDEGGKAEEDKAMVELILSKQQIELHVGSTRLLSRLIDGRFPNYQQIIPKDLKTTAIFSTSELLTASKRLHYFAKEMNNNLTLIVSSKEAKISTPQTQVGKDEAMLSAEVTGEENKIALSSSYILDFLNHLDGETVSMRMVDSQHPAIFSVPENPNFLHLIMPLRMQEG